MAKISPHPSLHSRAAPAKQNERLIVTDMAGDTVCGYEKHTQFVHDF